MKEYTGSGRKMQSILHWRHHWRQNTQEFPTLKKNLSGHSETKFCSQLCGLTAVWKDLWIPVVLNEAIKQSTSEIILRDKNAVWKFIFSFLSISRGNYESSSSWFWKICRLCRLLFLTYQTASEETIFKVKFCSFWTLIWMLHCLVLQFKNFLWHLLIWSTKRKKYSGFTILPKFLHVEFICI